MKKTILSVGWGPELRAEILDKVEFLNSGEIDFFHIVEIGPRFKCVNPTAPENIHFVSVPNSPQISQEDLRFLEKLEVEGLPTIRSMIAGDPYLRYFDSELALGYASVLAKAILKTIEDKKPLIVLASNDRLISSIALAVAYKTKTQFVAMAFTVIPDNRAWFIERLTPNSLISLKLGPNQGISVEETRKILGGFYQKSTRPAAYIAPRSMMSAFFEGFMLFGNKLKRYVSAKHEGDSRFGTFSFWQAASNRGRRLLNRASLIGLDMVTTPPKDKFAYYPMHMSPESMIDTWAVFYQNQLGLLRQIALALPLDMKLVVKLHFSDPDSYSAHELSALAKITGVLIASPDADARAFLESASLVFGITGTSCLEAALLGKPTIIFADTPYLEFPNNVRAKLPDELFTQIREMLRRSPPSQEDIEKAFVRYANRYLPGRVNDWNIPLHAADIEKYNCCFKELVNNVLNEKLNVS